MRSTMTITRRYRDSRDSKHAACTPTAEVVMHGLQQASSAPQQLWRPDAPAFTPPAALVTSRTFTPSAAKTRTPMETSVGL